MKMEWTANIAVNGVTMTGCVMVEIIARKATAAATIITVQIASLAKKITGSVKAAVCAMIAVVSAAKAWSIYA